MTQTIEPDALDTDEAFGSPIILSSPEVFPNSIGSAEAFGSPTITLTLQTVLPTGIASAFAFGSPVVTLTNQVVLPDGIASAFAFGSPTITLSLQAVLPTGIASAEAFGSPTVEVPQTIMPTGIASAEAFGSPTVSLLNQAVLPDSITSAEAFGSPTVSLLNQTVLPAAIASGEAFGSPTVTLTQQILSPASIASDEAFGSPIVTLTLQAVIPNGIASAEAFGVPEIQIQVRPASIASASAFGSPTVILFDQPVFPNAIESEEAFGNPTVRTVDTTAESYTFTPVVGTLIQPTDSVIIHMMGTAEPAANWASWLDLSAGFGGYGAFGIETLGFGLPTDPLRGRELVAVFGVIQPGYTVTPTVIAANDLDVEVSRNAGWPSVTRAVAVTSTFAGGAGVLTAPGTFPDGPGIQRYTQPGMFTPQITAADIGKAVAFTGSSIPGNILVAIILTVPVTGTITFSNPGGSAQALYDGIYSVGVADGNPVSVTVNGTLVSVPTVAGDDPAIALNDLLVAINALAIPNLIADKIGYRILALLGTGFVSLTYAPQLLLNEDLAAPFSLWNEQLLAYGGYYPYTDAWMWGVDMAMSGTPIVSDGDLPQSIDGIGVPLFDDGDLAQLPTGIGVPTFCPAIMPACGFIYFQRAYDSGTNQYVYWTSLVVPNNNPSVTIPMFTGTLSAQDIIFRIEP